MVRAVIFDLDDTLISEKEYIKSGYHHIAASFEVFGVDKNQVFDVLMSLFKVSPQKVFNRLYEKYHIEYSKEMIIDLVNEYRGHLPNIHFYDDVLPCISNLKNLGIKVGIITDGYAIAQRQKLKAVQADEYFEEIIVTDELGRNYWKPHPKSFELIKERLEVDFDEMIYVGDNPEKDFYIGKIYPIKTVKIYRKGVHQEKDYINNVKETYSIDNLHELLYLIGLESIGLK